MNIVCPARFSDAARALADGNPCYPTLMPIAERMAVRVVSAMLMITLHLLFFSFVMMMVIFDTLIDVAVDAEDTSAVDENLGE